MKSVDDMVKRISKVVGEDARFTFFVKNGKVVFLSMDAMVNKRKSEEGNLCYIG